MSKRNAVRCAFDGFGRDAGMEKKSGSWYRRTPEIISVSNLQKSNYGPRYYFNQAFWLRSLGDELYPKEWHCHVRTRLAQAFPAREQEIEDLFKLDVPMSDEERIAAMRHILDGELAPLIERASTAVELRNMVDEGVLSAMVNRDAQDAFRELPR